MTAAPPIQSNTAPEAPEPIDDRDRDTARDLEHFGITSHPHVSYSWNGYRYSNASDAIAAAKRAAR